MLTFINREDIMKKLSKTKKKGEIKNEQKTAKEHFNNVRTYVTIYINGKQSQN